MKKILILGAAGYLGARICKQLIEEGYNVTGFCRSLLAKERLLEIGLNEVVIGDIRDMILISELAERNFDVLINLVSLDHHESNGNPSFVSSVNVIPTWALLDVFSKKKLPHFIYFSTAQVYGKLDKGGIDEQFPLNSLNVYGLSHSLSENICEYFNRNTDTACTTFRLSNSYGSPVFHENNCWSLVINDLCKVAITKRELRLMSDGTPLRDFIHGNDVVKAIELSINLKSDSQKKGVFNLSSGNTLSIMELAITVRNTYRDRYGLEIPVFNNLGNVFDKNLETNINDRYIILNSKLRSIGFSPTVNLKEGINDLFCYLENIYG